MSEFKCASCGSTGFAPSVLPGRCTFCDGTEGGNPPVANTPAPAQDRVRVLRVIEYEGPRADVERTLKKSIHGEVTHGKLTIRAAVLGVVPVILSGATTALSNEPSNVIRVEDLYSGLRKSPGAARQGG